MKLHFAQRPTPSMSSPEFWEEKCRRLINVELARRRMTGADLASLMRKQGYEDAAEKSIAVRLYRGNFSFAFALKAFQALGVKTLDLSDIDSSSPPPHN